MRRAWRRRSSSARSVVPPLDARCRTTAAFFRRLFTFRGFVADACSLLQRSLTLVGERCCLVWGWVLVQVGGVFDGGGWVWCAAVLGGVTGFTGWVFGGCGAFVGCSGVVFVVFAGFWPGLGVDLCRGVGACNVF